jgi:hypothetical protein
MYVQSIRDESQNNKQIPEGYETEKIIFQEKRGKEKLQTKRKLWAFLIVPLRHRSNQGKKLSKEKNNKAMTALPLWERKGLPLSLDYSTVHASESLLEGWEVELKPMVRGFPSLA